MGKPTWITNVLMDLAMQAEKDGLSEASQILMDAMVNVSLVDEVDRMQKPVHDNVVKLLVP